MKRLILILSLLFALPAYAVTTVPADVDGVTDSVVLKSAAFSNHTSFATRVQGAKADTALQPTMTKSTSNGAGGEANDLWNTNFVYNGTAASPYTYVGSAAQVRSIMTGGTGTSHGLSVHSRADASGNSANEHTALFLDTSADAASRIWGIDASVMGPYSTQADLLMGPSFFIGNYNATPPTNGSYGAVISTRQGSGGGDKAADRAARQTYPVDVGLGIYGWSGTAWPPSGNGFDTALKIGGVGGGWFGATEYSRFGTGAEISDYANYGIYLHGQRSGTGPAIAVASDGGNVVVGATSGTEKLEVTGSIKINSGSLKTSASDGCATWASGVLGSTGTACGSAEGGTVSSVGLALPAEFTVSNSPVTGAGTLTGAWASQAANKVFASPDGSSGTPAFRAMVSDDVPTTLIAKELKGAATTSSGSVTMAITSGSTTLTTSSSVTLAAGDYLSPLNSLALYKIGTGGTGTSFTLASPANATLTQTYTVFHPNATVISPSGNQDMTLISSASGVPRLLIGHSLSIPQFVSTLSVAGATSDAAKFINTSNSSSTQGAGMQAYSADGAAMASGDRLGFLIFGGSSDANNALINSASVEGYATETWTTTSSPSSLALRVTPSGSTTRATVASVTSAGMTVTGNVLATGIVDGKTPITLTTGTSATLGAATYLSGYTINTHATMGQAVGYTLPAAAAGLQHCVRNGTGRTGIITVTAGSGDVIDLDGTATAVAGNIASGGALGDSACFVAIDADTWIAYINKGTWAD